VVDEVLWVAVIPAHATFDIGRESCVARAAEHFLFVYLGDHLLIRLL
jgi:hypothetical protein